MRTRRPWLAFTALVIAATIRPSDMAAQAVAGQKRPPTCAAALTRYEKFADVPSPHDTLPPPALSGSFSSRDEMERARLEAVAARGATGYVIETRSETLPDAGATRTMTRVVPVFVPKDEARVRKACAPQKEGGRPAGS